MARQHACLSLCFSMLFTEQRPSIDFRERRTGLKDHFVDPVFGNDAASFVFCCLASVRRPKLDSREDCSEESRPIASLPGKGEIDWFLCCGSAFSGATLRSPWFVLSFSFIVLLRKSSFLSRLSDEAQDTELSHCTALHFTSLNSVDQLLPGKGEFD